MKVRFQLGATLVWNIWKARNISIFENYHSQPDHIVAQANSMVKEYTSRPPASVYKPMTWINTIHYRWISLCIDTVKINVDAALNGTRRKSSIWHHS